MIPAGTDAFTATQTGIKPFMPGKSNGKLRNHNAGCHIREYRVENRTVKEESRKTKFEMVLSINNKQQLKSAAF